MTNKEVWRIAIEQSAIDLNCSPLDFQRTEPVISLSKPNEKARRYLALPFECNLVSYGNNVVASVTAEYVDIVQEYLSAYPFTHLMETPHLHILQSAFEPHGLSVCFMAEYFLPDMENLQVLPCRYTTKVLHPEEFDHLYTPDWANALCEKRKHLDMLAVGAYDSDRLIGLAGCSADCDTMWQIGVDVLAEYRGQGIAAALTTRLAQEILDRGKVPFYCCAWCNIPSVRNALKSGFKPAWVEMTVRSNSLLQEMNRA